jgi:hypothetical protein
MIQQYAPSFRDAGIEASQLVAIIQNSEGGLFTDQNMNAIVMGIKNIRLMTNQTSEALAKMGIDGAEMTQKLNDGTMTIFDALGQVSEAIERTGSGSQAAGEVMQSVFGRQGTMAGTKLGEAIATLNTNLEETKTQTGELGESFVRLNEANLELEQTMQEIFGMNGWEDMNNFMKTELANTLTFTLEFLINIRDTLKSIGSYASDTWNDFVGRFTGGAYKPKENARTNAQNQNPTAQWQWRMPGFGGYTTPPMQPARPTQQQPQNSYQVVTSGGKVVRESRVVNGQKVDEPKQTNQRTYEQVKADIDRAKKEMENAKDSFSKGTAKSLVDYYEQELKRLPKPDVKPKTTNTKSTSTTTKKETWKPIEMADLTLGTQKVQNDNSDFLFGRSRQDVQKDLQRAQHAEAIAPDEWTRAEARKDVTRYQKELEKMNGEGDVTKGLMKDAYTHDFGKDMDALSKDRDRMMMDDGGVALKEVIGKVGDKISSLSQIAGGLQQMGLKLPNGVNELIGVMQGAMQVVQGVQAFMEASETVALVANTTAIGLNTAAMVAMTAAVNANTVSEAIPFFRNGGIVPHAATGLMVPGNDFSDSTPVMVSSGELILNKAQQNAVAQGLQEERGRGDYSSTPYVDGEKIYLGMNNFLRRSGRGEIVTSRR